MEIINLWVGIARNSQLNRILFLPSSHIIKMEVTRTITESYENFIALRENIEEKNPTSLILEEKYFVNTSGIPTDDFLYRLREKLLLDDSLSANNDVISLRTNSESQLDDRDRVRILIIELEEELLFLYVNARKNIRKSKVFDIFNKPEGAGVGANIVDINAGINIPKDIVSVFNKSESKLYVLDVLNFEKMFYINDAYKVKAEEKFQKFIREEYKLGEEQWRVRFQNPDMIKESFMSSTRILNRLANYDGNSTYSIDNIKTAVNQVENEAERVIFQDNSEEMIVNTDNYKTFFAIIHNGIVKRLISGEVEVI